MTIGFNFHIAHGHFLWQDISNDDIKISIVGISHYWGRLCFLNTSCWIHDLTTYWKFFGNPQPNLWATFSSSNTKKDQKWKAIGPFLTYFMTYVVRDLQSNGKFTKNPRLLLRTEQAKIIKPFGDNDTDDSLVCWYSKLGTFVASAKNTWLRF